MRRTRETRAERWFTYMTAKLVPAGAPEEHVAPLRTARRRELPGFSPALPDREIVPGELLDLPGRRLRAIWTPGHTPGHVCLHLEEWRIPPNVEETARAAVHAAATETAARLRASDVPAAEDAVNAALGCLPRRAPNYCLLKVKATLGLPSASRELLAQRAADEQRVRRLRFLKQNLYDHPDLVVLDQLEHHASGALGTSTLPNSNALLA